MGSSKISPYNLGAISPELENFREEITNLINNGKQGRIISAGTPTWRADPGQMILFRPTSGGTTNYVYLDSAWVSTWSITV
jgi:hypothetical protein